jgi:DNA-binding NtrC family response regulator
VVVQSEVDQGTIFSIYLPRIAGAASVATERGATVRTPQGDGNILVVEDEEAVAALVQRVLAAHGYRVLTAKDAIEALAILANPQKPLDLLITDMVVPGGMHGGELADAARLMRCGLEVVYMSGYSRDSNIHGGSLDSSVRFLQKPFTSSSLVEMVEEALAVRAQKGRGQR